MQLQDEIRGLRENEAHVDLEHLEVARHVLDIEMGRSTRARTPRRRNAMKVGLGLGLGGLGVAGVGTFAVLSIVAGSVVAPPAAPSAAAAEVLQEASAAALNHVSATDAALAPGQYLRVVTTLDQVASDGFAEDRAPTSGAFQRRVVSVLYVPADRADDWILETRPEEILGVYGPEGDEFLQKVRGEPSTVEPSVTAYPAGIRTYGDEQQPFDMHRDDYDEMPRDPAQLLAWFEDRTPGGYAAMEILNALYQNLPPADVRAALLGAFALIPGITLTNEEGDLATIEWSRSESRQQFVVNTRTGMLVSIIDPQRHPSDIVPEGMPDGVQTFEMSVVDSAPTPPQ